MKVVEFPKANVPSIAGPDRRGADVIIDGRHIPNMHCHERENETEIIIDGRFSYTFPKEWGYLAAAMAAQAMAIGAGYSHLGAKTKDRPFAPQVMKLDVIP